MALRWKNQSPELQPNFVDPQGVQGTMMQGYQPGIVNNPAIDAAQQMQGYNPNNVSASRLPAFAGQPGSGNGYKFDSTGIDAYNAEQGKRQQIMQAIQQKETELAQIEAKIAEIDKATPAIKANPKEWEIAAKRAEIGDMSAYDNLISRGNQASSSVSGIENGLYNAAEELWGVKDEDNTARAVSSNKIEVALQKAEDWANKNNVDIETGMPRIYYELRHKFHQLKDEYDKPGAGETGGSLNFENANSVKAQLATLDKEGKLSDSHIKEIDEYNKKNPNDKYAAELKAAADKYRKETKEAKGRAEALKKEANSNIDKMEAMTPEAQDKFWRSLPEKTKKEMLKYGGWKTNNKKNPPVMYFARGK